MDCFAELTEAFEQLPAIVPAFLGSLGGLPGLLSRPWAALGGPCRVLASTSWAGREALGGLGQALLGLGEPPALMRAPSVERTIGDVDASRKAVHDGIGSLQIDQPVFNSPFWRGGLDLAGLASRGELLLSKSASRSLTTDAR